MPTFTREILLGQSIDNLRSLATAFDTPHKNSGDVEELIADILEFQALHEAEASSAPPKRKRGRPSKAEIAARDAAQKAAELLAKAQEDQQASSVTEVTFSASDFDEVEADSSIPSAERVDSSTDDDLPDFLRTQINEAKQKATDSLENVDVSGDSDVLDFRAENTEDEIDETVAHSDSLSTADNDETNGYRWVDPDFFIIEDVADDNSSYLLDNLNDGYTQHPPYSTTQIGENQTDTSHTTIEEGALTTHSVPELTEEEQKMLQEMMTVECRGVLEIVNEGGFLRSSDYNYISSPDDIFVPRDFIEQFSLKTGDVVEGLASVPQYGSKYFELQELYVINGCSPDVIRNRVSFEHLTPLFPYERFNLSEGSANNITCRIVDLFTPIGKGQRALIVAQPKTGKTMLMKNIANAISRNHPDTYLMMLLIDERPEEGTDMMRTVNAEVIASTFDESASHHVKIAGIVLEKAKRMVECGHDVVIFLDSITRLARAYNTVAPASGKVLSGGVDSNALQKPKRFFGAARKIENGGSLTIIATALVETGSKMDEVIFEEFKGTGNMELQLERSLANKRIFPAVNLVASSTRRDDLLHDQDTLNKMYIVRNYISDMNPLEALTDVKKHLETTSTNQEFFALLQS